MRTRCSGNARAHSLIIRVTQFGAARRAGLQVLNKPEDEDTESDTDLATVQKGPKYFVLYCHIHIFATILHVSHMLHI